MPIDSHVILIDPHEILINFHVIPIDSHLLPIDPHVYKQLSQVTDLFVILVSNILSMYTV